MLRSEIELDASSYSALLLRFPHDDLKTFYCIVKQMRLRCSADEYVHFFSVSTLTALEGKINKTVFASLRAGFTSWCRRLIGQSKAKRQGRAGALEGEKPSHWLQQQRRLHTRFSISFRYNYYTFITNAGCTPFPKIHFLIVALATPYRAVLGGRLPHSLYCCTYSIFTRLHFCSNVKLKANNFLPPACRVSIRLNPVQKNYRQSSFCE